MEEHILQYSLDGKKWHFATSFREDQLDRYGKPMTPEFVIEEAKSYHHHHNLNGRKRYVQIVIPIRTS